MHGDDHHRRDKYLTVSQGDNQRAATPTKTLIKDIIREKFYNFTLSDM